MDGWKDTLMDGLMGMERDERMEKDMKEGNRCERYSLHLSFSVALSYSLCVTFCPRSRAGGPP